MHYFVGLAVLCFCFFFHILCPLSVGVTKEPHWFPGHQPELEPPPFKPTARSCYMIDYGSSHDSGPCLLSAGKPQEPEGTQVKLSSALGQTGQLQGPCQPSPVAPLLIPDKCKVAARPITSHVCK